MSNKKPARQYLNNPKLVIDALKNKEWDVARQLAKEFSGQKFWQDIGKAYKTHLEEKDIRPLKKPFGRTGPKEGKKKVNEQLFANYVDLLQKYDGNIESALAEHDGGKKKKHKKKKESKKQVVEQKSNPDLELKIEFLADLLGIPDDDEATQELLVGMLEQDNPNFFEFIDFQTEKEEDQLSFSRILKELLQSTPGHPDKFLNALKEKSDVFWGIYKELTAAPPSETWLCLVAFHQFDVVKAEADWGKASGFLIRNPNRKFLGKAVLAKQSDSAWLKKYESSWPSLATNYLSGIRNKMFLASGLDYSAKLPKVPDSKIDEFLLQLIAFERKCRYDPEIEEATFRKTNTTNIKQIHKGTVTSYQKFVHALCHQVIDDAILDNLQPHYGQIAKSFFQKLEELDTKLKHKKTKPISYLQKLEDRGKLSEASTLLKQCKYSFELFLQLFFVEEQLPDKKIQEMPDAIPNEDLGITDNVLEAEEEALSLLSNKYTSLNQISSFPERKEYEEPRENQAAGEALAEIFLPADLKGIIDNLITEHRDDKNFQVEWFKPILDYFKGRKIKLSKLRNENTESEEAKDEESPEQKESTEEESPEQKEIKDGTIMVYASRIRMYLLKTGYWHGNNWEEKTHEWENSENKTIKDEYLRWIKMDPRLQFREFKAATQKIELSKKQPAWTKELAKLQFMPEALRTFSADAIQPGLINRIRAYQKQRLDQRLDSTILLVHKPTEFMNFVLNGFWTNDTRGSRLYCALLLASGRRPKDLYFEGCFRPLESSNSDRLSAKDRFECLAYTGIKPGLSKFKKGGAIPLLCPYYIFVNALRRFREMHGHKSKQSYITDPFNRRSYDEVFEDAMRRNLIGFQEEKKFTLGAREFRSMYARYSIAIFGEGKNYNLWIKSVLMHESVTTSLNYSRVVFPQDNMQRIQPWQLNGPGNALERELGFLYIDAKAKNKKKIYEEKTSNRKCLGLTFEEAKALIPQAPPEILDMVRLFFQSQESAENLDEKLIKAGIEAAEPGKDEDDNKGEEEEEPEEDKKDEEPVEAADENEENPDEDRTETDEDEDK